MSLLFAAGGGGERGGIVYADVLADWRVAIHEDGEGPAAAKARVLRAQATKVLLPV